MSTPSTYLTALDAQRIHQDVIEESGAPSILRDFGALESAVMRPRHTAYYEQADLFMQAAMLMAGIAFAHAFEDGNKRLAYSVGGTFLLLNGVRITADPVKFAQWILELLNRTDPLTVVTQLFAAWLEQNSRPA